MFVITGLFYFIILVQRKADTIDEAMLETVRK